MSGLAPVPADGATCANCSAPLAADQRYCLSCGTPVSPVRLAFLDVLQSEAQPQLAPAALATAPLPYAAYNEPVSGPAWMRRYAPLFGVLSVLLLALLVGLLVGHWVTQSKTPAAQVVKVEGLGGLALGASATTPSATSGSASTAKTNSSASKEEQAEEAEAKAEEKKAVAPPKPKQVSSGTIDKLSSTTGKKHQEEINKLGTAPIAVP